MHTLSLSPQYHTFHGIIVRMFTYFLAIAWHSLLSLSLARFLFCHSQFTIHIQINRNCQCHLNSMNSICRNSYRNSIVFFNFWHPPNKITDIEFAQWMAQSRPMPIMCFWTGPIEKEESCHNWWGPNEKLERKPHILCVSANKNGQTQKIDWKKQHEKFLIIFEDIACHVASRRVAILRCLHPIPMIGLKMVCRSTSEVVHFNDSWKKKRNVFI